MTFNDLRDFYKSHYSLGYLNGGHGHGPMESRIILICLIVYVYLKNKPKNPDMTYYSLICKLGEKKGLPEDFMKGLAIQCEDISYQETNPPTFGLKGTDIIKEINYILDSYLPF